MEQQPQTKRCLIEFKADEDGVQIRFQMEPEYQPGDRDGITIMLAHLLDTINRATVNTIENSPIPLEDLADIIGGLKNHPQRELRDALSVLVQESERAHRAITRYSNGPIRVFVVRGPAVEVFDRVYQQRQMAFDN